MHVAHLHSLGAHLLLLPTLGIVDASASDERDISEDTARDFGLTALRLNF